MTSFLCNVIQWKNDEKEENWRWKRRSGLATYIYVHIYIIYYISNCNYYESLYATLKFVYHGRIKRGEYPKQDITRRYSSRAIFFYKRRGEESLLRYVNNLISPKMQSLIWFFIYWKNRYVSIKHASIHFSVDGGRRSRAL